jgi:hypothetical protein
VRPCLPGGVVRGSQNEREGRTRDRRRIRNRPAAVARLATAGSASLATGRHARVAIGVAALPYDVAVAVEASFEVSV